MAWYKLSDLAAEIRCLPECVIGRTDIVHYLDGEHTAQYLPRWLQRFSVSRTKTVASYHQPTATIEKLLDPRVLSELDHVTLVSPDQRAWFEQFVEPQRISVILHGIDTEFFKPFKRRHRSLAFRCVSAGYWLRDWDAIRRVAENLRLYRDIEFHLITPRPTGLENLENVIVHRDVSDEALLSVYQQSDVMLLPLKASTANNTLLEGIACGLPVVSTRLDSVAAYIRPGEGILIDRNDIDALTGTILDLRQREDVRAELAAAARERARELDWRNIAPRYENVYASLMKSSSSPECPRTRSKNGLGR